MDNVHNMPIIKRLERVLSHHPKTTKNSTFDRREGAVFPGKFIYLFILVLRHKELPIGQQLSEGSGEILFTAKGSRLH